MTLRCLKRIFQEMFTKIIFYFSLNIEFYTHKVHCTRLAHVNSWCDIYKWAAPSEFGTYRLCEQRRFRRACASAQSRQNLRCSLIKAVSQEEPSDRKPDPWPLWMAGHAQLKFVMTECSKTQIRLSRPKYGKQGTASGKHLFYSY